MSIISPETRNKILLCLNDIMNLKDTEWTILEPNIKLKIIHHMCANIANPTNIKTFNTIPLKHYRPKKIIQLCGFNKQSNTNLFNKYKLTLLNHNFNFRKNYNKKKTASYGNMHVNEYNQILQEYNQEFYNFLILHKNNINANKLYWNLIQGNEQKIINKSTNEQINILNIKQDNNFLNIEFDNNVTIKFELYLTSEKITNNIPAKYKINLINII
jgi:hypothetical protein